MKNVTIFLSIGVLVLLILFLLGEDKRWFLFNVDQAEEYAISLLNGDSEMDTPKRFIDYTVSASNGYVLFTMPSKQNKVYGYFPDKEPSTIEGNISKINWRPLGGKWFVSNVE